MTNLLVVGEIARIQQWVEHRVEGCTDFSGGEVNPLLDMGLDRDISDIQTQADGHPASCRAPCASILTMSMAVLPNKPLSASRATYRAMALLSHTPPCGVSRVGTCPSIQASASAADFVANKRSR